MIGLGRLVPGCVRGPLVVLVDGALRVLLRVFRVVFGVFRAVFPFVFLSDGHCVVLRVRQIVFPRVVGFRVAYGVPRGFCPVFGPLILGSCAGENRHPLLPAVLQFDFCNISQNRQFLGLVGLV